MAVKTVERARGAAEASLRRARDHLLKLQHEQGWWKGELETNVTMDAEDLLLRQFLGIRGEEETRLAANWIRSVGIAPGGGGLAVGAEGLVFRIEGPQLRRLEGAPTGRPS